MSTAKHVIVWTPGDARIWWACSACKVEAGISPPVNLDEFLDRVLAFKSAHKACADSAQEGKAWRA